ncbi:cytochrome b [Roseobacter sp. EG26]|uniref:cytochrome b n=1 Tax=Roseobacter sp. EG26 TaxID=3412477 RepID=UPI003CE59FB5
MKSTPQKYGTGAVTIHWVSAALILVQLVSGFRAASTVDYAAKEAILAMHAPLGIAILVLTIARILWWQFVDNKPAPVAGDPVWQTFAAKAVHVMFYIVLLGMAASGIGTMAASGAGQILSGAVDAPLPDFSDYAPRVPHGIGARLMVGLFVFHAGAAIYHHFVKRDGLLARMWYGAN